MKKVFALLMSLGVSSWAQAMKPADCSDMEVWDFDMAMCMPLPMAGMPMRMLMIHGNGFLAAINGQGPRGRSAIAAPNMFMVDVGSSVGDRHYFNVDFMGTLERWTFPSRGYPLLGQIGEEDQKGRPFVDAQHPHSSPVMGLTFSDTIKLDTGSKDHLKIFFAPRGQSTDGPMAFMHRPTGLLNPDAPLGHHIGQDVGHISSTVIGASLRLNHTIFEASAFNGTEPEPMKVDLPLGAPNSFGLRLIQELSSDHAIMASLARIQSEGRYSASVYDQFPLAGEWSVQNAFIYGALTHHDEVSILNSFGEEFAVQGDRPKVWGRLEVLQRTAAELEIPGVANSNQGRWVTALTLGYTHTVARMNGAELGLGLSVTKDYLPVDFRSSYGGNPWSGKLFLHLSGMGMWDL